MPWGIVTQSQSQGSLYRPNYDEDMPRSKKQRTNGKLRAMRSAKSRVPRALSTRGTPDGYYEIPVTIYRRLYWNMSSGLWTTDTVTGAQSGSTGYQGFGMGTQLDTSLMFLGISGGSSIRTVPGFSQLQGVFDECKIARIHYEFWIAGQAKETNSTLGQAPNIWIVEDTTGIDPPTTQDEILQYGKVRTVKGDINSPLKFTIYPKIREGASSDGSDTSTNETSGLMDSARYCSTSKPAVFHFGLRGWFETNAAVATAQYGYLCIKETQIRRYKRVK